ncbi:MAG: fibronectin type III-like domain-contianing protein, partial [Armatimonadota bacterium]|nr:fibronectin type III-like domain-contianing protein [Armatimonadota bacterium]
NVTVRNTGKRAGDEVAELYLRPLPGSGSLTAAAGATEQPMPRIELEGFQKVMLSPGQSKELSFTLTQNQLHLVNTQGQRTVNPGGWDVFVGGEQPNPEDASAVPFNGVRTKVRTP